MVSRPRVYSDRLPKNVAQDASDKVGPMFEIHRTSTCNMAQDLYLKITRSEYFKCLYVFKSFAKVVDVIYEKVTYLEPWTYRGTSKRGFWKSPSTAFCLLLKLFHLELTESQVRQLLDHGDSPYLRAMGMLYVRFGAPPHKLWPWLGPYCDDLEEMTPDARGSETCTLGEFARRLLTQTEPYYETPLPPVPVALERRLLEHIELLQGMIKRAKKNERFIGTERLRKGASGFLCCARDFFDHKTLDEPLKLVWRTDATIDFVDDPYDGAPRGTYPTYRVVFANDGAVAVAKLGTIDFPPDDQGDGTAVIKAVQQVLKNKDTGDEPRSRPPRSRRSPSRR